MCWPVWAAGQVPARSDCEGTAIATGCFVTSFEQVRHHQALQGPLGCNQQAPHECECSEEERISVNVDGTFHPPAAPDGFAVAGVGFVQASEGESSGGVVTMIDPLFKDLGKELTEVEVEKKKCMP